MATIRLVASWAVLILGASVAYVGAFFGYATSATDHYGLLLRLWATWTALAIVVLAALAFFVKGAVRYVALGLIALVFVAGLDPLRRSIEIEPSGPSCTKAGPSVVSRVTELPSSILRDYRLGIRSPGESFSKVDGVGPFWDPNRPRIRLICGYPTQDGYVVEHEFGSVAYGDRAAVYRKTAAGYAFVSLRPRRNRAP